MEEGLLMSVPLIFFILLVLFLPLSVKGLREEDSVTRYALLKKQDFYRLGEFKGAGGVTLRRAQFGLEVGEKGALVFINGWAENLFKYIELFYDLNLLGFSPIYTYDHRGQGFSERLLSHRPHISHVESYAHYEKDLDIFIKQVLMYPEVQKQKLFLVAHSMGGNIVLSYMQKGPVPFRAVALSAPMLKIQTMPSVLDFFPLVFMKGICLFFCQWPLPWINPQKSQKEKLTSSQERINFAKHVAKTVPKMPLSQLSAQWVLKSFSAGSWVMDKKRIQKIKTPLLILQAEKEVLVSNTYQNRFCKVIPNFCHIKTFKTGRHELFLEKDKVRDQAITATVQFFDQTFLLDRS